jgi:hypothetical protein
MPFIFYLFSAHHHFTRNALLIVSLQAALVTGIVALFYHLTNFVPFLRSNWGWLVTITLIYFILYFALAIHSDLFRFFPYNIIALVAYTLCSSIMITFLTCIFHPTVLYIGGCIIFSMCLSVILFTFQYKLDVFGISPFIILLTVGGIASGIYIYILILIFIYKII